MLKNILSYILVIGLLATLGIATYFSIAGYYWARLAYTSELFYEKESKAMMFSYWCDAKGGIANTFWSDSFYCLTKDTFYTSVSPEEIIAPVINIPNF